MKYPLSLSISIPAHTKYLSSIRNFWMENGCKIGIKRSVIDDFALVLEEHCSNIVRYGYLDQQGNIKISFKIKKASVEVFIRDRGCPFEKTIIDKAQMPDFFKTKQTGKMGIPIIKELMDEFSYMRTANGTNVWKLKKLIEREL